MIKIRNGMASTQTKRLFVAAFPPVEIVARLQAVPGDLVKEVPARAVRWTRPDQIHLTLFFLGAVEVSRVEEVQAAVVAACQEHPSPRVNVTGLGCFPGPAQPRILWAGLSGDDESLRRLKQSIDAQLLASGFAGEDRPFHPHLTLGRVTQLNLASRKKITAALEKARAAAFGSWQINRIDLMQSILSPHGSTYAILRSVAL